MISFRNKMKEVNETIVFHTLCTRIPILLISSNYIMRKSEENVKIGGECEKWRGECTERISRGRADEFLIRLPREWNGALRSDCIARINCIVLSAWLEVLDGSVCRPVQVPLHCHCHVTLRIWLPRFPTLVLPCICCTHFGHFKRRVSPLRNANNTDTSRILEAHLHSHVGNLTRPVKEIHGITYWRRRGKP